MSFHLHSLNIEKPDGATSAYAVFYKQYMRIQLFQNFFANTVSSLEYHYEKENDGDWDKNFPPGVFNFPAEPMDEQLVTDIKNEVKCQIGFTKDYYLVSEEAALVEFIFLMAAYESYLRHGYGLLLRATPLLMAKRIKFSKMTQEAIAREMVSATPNLNLAALLEDSIQELLLEFSRSKNALSGTEVISDLLSLQEFTALGKVINREEIKETLKKFVELRNIHLHNAGVLSADGTYQKILGLYRIEEFRGMLVNLVPALDKAIKKTIDSGMVRVGV